MSSPSRHVAILALLAGALAVSMAASRAADRDTDNDGLPDAWEATVGRAYGCDPRHADVLVYAIQRTDMTDKVTDTIRRATAYFDSLDVSNPDGTRGIHLHVIRGPKVPGDANYVEQRQKYLPPRLKGYAHFEVFSTDPGGQTNGQASISGVAEFGWNSFVHELGHQLGPEHEALGFKVQSPLHASLMNYSYLDYFEGGSNAVHYSDGRFAKLRMKETDLDETLPYPIQSLTFLAAMPYRFPLKADGNRTLVDWNRNGIFGERHVRADINYEPSTWLGERFKVEAAATAPSAAYLSRDFFVAYGVQAGANRPVVLRKYLGNGRWGPRILTGIGNATGDPTLVAWRGRLWIASQTPSGVRVVALRPSGDGARVEQDPGGSFPPSRPPHQPTLAVLDDRLVMFFHESASHRVLASVYSGHGTNWNTPRDTEITSVLAPGVAWQPILRQAVIVSTADTNAKGRLVAHFRPVTNGYPEMQGTDDWLGGERGGTATSARPSVLVDTTRDAGPRGRVYAYYAASVPGLPAFFSMQVADKRFNGGWLERSAYDEWTITDVAPAAAMSPDGGIAYCYRDKSSHILNCSFGGDGIEAGEMGDVDEVSFIRNAGLRQSLGR